jgi:sterol 3beta-glucosyltransferase
LFGIPGYTLKGVERDLAKRRVSRLTAEVMLIRVRRSLEVLRVMPREEQDDVIRKWKALQAQRDVK